MKTKYLSFLIVSLLLVQQALSCGLAGWEKEIDLRLPTAEEEKAGNRNKDEKVISIFEDGTVQMNKKIYTLDQLQAELGKLVKINKNQPIRVRGDEKVDYRRIVRVIDHCRKAGVWNLSFVTGVPKKNEEAKKSFRGSLPAVIDVGVEGGFSVRGKTMTQEELTKKLQLLARVNAEQVIVIRGGAETPYKYIVEAMESCSKAKIRNISYTIKTSEASPSNPTLK